VLSLAEFIKLNISKVFVMINFFAFTGPRITAAPYIFYFLFLHDYQRRSYLILIVSFANTSKTVNKDSVSPKFPERNNTEICFQFQVGSLSHGRLATLMEPLFYLRGQGVPR
jgi:hypothetical protein